MAATQLNCLAGISRGLQGCFRLGGGAGADHVSGDCTVSITRVPHCRSSSKARATKAAAKEQTDKAVKTNAVARRTTLLLSAAGGAALLVAQPAEARDRRNRKEVSLEDYKTSSDGIRYYDVELGKGEVAEDGDSAIVHFDCVWRTLTVVSSRESKLLGGNRVIAEPYEFVLGAKPGSERRRDYVENANGLFSAQASPKPPKALYAITQGMRVGGKRTVHVTPEIGYGNKGFAEVPPGDEFEMNIELLEVKKPTSK